VLGWLKSAKESRVGGEDRAPVEQSCPGIARVLGALFASGKQPEVLDLGQLSGTPALYLADRGARLSVERFEPPAAAERRAGAEPPVEPEPLRIPQPDGRFDLVLAWEHCDFVPPDRFEEFTAELRRVMAPGAWLVLLSRDRSSREGAEPDRPASYRLAADDRMLRAPSPGPPRPRWAYPNRVIERALAPLAVQGIHLLGDRMREFVARKPAR
jgi:SAM-dependent methyltransferase